MVFIFHYIYYEKCCKQYDQVKIVYDSKSFVLLDSTKPFSFMFATFSDLHTFYSQMTQT